MIRARARILFLAALLVPLALLCSAASADLDSRVSVQKDAGQQDALAALHQATGALILSEIPKLPHTLPEEMKGLPAQKAILQLTKAYHLHAMVSHDRVLFVRRFWDWREEPDLPQEEMTSILNGLDSLLGSVAPNLSFQDAIRGRNRFLASLSPDQVVAAQRGVLTLAGMSRDQRDRWQTLTAHNAFDNANEEVHKFAVLFREFDQASGRWEAADRLETTSNLMLTWPAETPLAGRAAVYNWGHGREPRFRDVKPGVSAEEIQAPSKPVSACPRTFRSDTPLITLADLVRQIGEENQVSVSVPNWAKERQFYLFGNGSTGDQILQSVADLNGWIVRRTGKAAVSLERPKFAPPTDFRDFCGKAIALVPPVARDMVRTDDLESGDQVRMDRQNIGFYRLTGYLLKLKGDLLPFQVRELAPEWKRAFANLLFCRALKQISLFVDRDRPLGWLVAPELGTFHITGGGIRPGEHGFIQFKVPIQNVNGTTTWNSWGWWAHTAKPDLE